MWRTYRAPSGDLILVPKGSSEGPVLFIFPGIDGPNLYGKTITSGALYIQTVLPKSLSSFCAVVIAHSSLVSWRTLRDSSSLGFRKLGYTPTRSYLMGFSGGGIPVQEVIADPLFHKIFLVDASVHPKFWKALSSGTPIEGLDGRVEMVFNSTNWKGLFPDTYRSLGPLAQQVIRGGGRAEEVTSYHLKILNDSLKNLALSITSGELSIFPPPLVSPHELGLGSFPLNLIAGIFLWISRRRELLKR